jgi:transcriptional regulator with XRE-family HTH domain
MSQSDDVVVRNRRQQAEWYGEPLGDRVRRLLDRLDVSQTALAEIVGLSAPMLSQLMSGHRAKISNPAVLSRLLAVEALAASPDFDRLPARDVRERLDGIRRDAVPAASTVQLSVAPAPPAPPGDAVAVIQALLRAAGSAAEIEAAASLLDVEFPDLATFLRVYGNGRTADARSHLARTLGSG